MLSALRSLYLGGTIVLLPKFDPVETLKAIERYRINSITMVPTMINRLKQVSEEEIKHFDLSSLKKLCSLASPLPTTTKEWILAKLPHVELSEVYAATEAGLITMLYPEDQPKKTRCVGQAVIGTEIRILDNDKKDLPPGQVGEIFVKNLTSIKSYLNFAKDTSECFEGDWITLGDMGKLDYEGYLYIVDRKKDMIKSGGVNIFPAEIEDTLMKHPCIHEVAVIGIPDHEWGESIKAIVVLKPGAQATEQDIRNFCRELIADFKVPKSVDFASELPKSPFGKILKRVVRDGYWKDLLFKV
jgi:long-chain acyl-CoA synthetase